MKKNVLLSREELKKVEQEAEKIITSFFAYEGSLITKPNRAQLDNARDILKSETSILLCNLERLRLAEEEFRNHSKVKGKIYSQDYYTGVKKRRIETNRSNSIRNQIINLLISSDLSTPKARLHLYSNISLLEKGKFSFKNSITKTLLHSNKLKYASQQSRIAISANGQKGLRFLMTKYFITRLKIRVKNNKPRVSDRSLFIFSAYIELFIKNRTVHESELDKKIESTRKMMTHTLADTGENSLYSTASDHLDNNEPLAQKPEKNDLLKTEDLDNWVKARLFMCAKIYLKLE